VPHPAELGRTQRGADHEDSHAERAGEGVREDDQRDEDGSTEFRILEAAYDREVPIADDER
jgi:hypothetical protein